MPAKPDITALTAACSQDQKSVVEAIASRQSVRGFKPEPVSRDTVEAILKLASRAPSGSNVQPWKVYACTGAARDEVVSAATIALETESDQHVEPYHYYPRQWREPYLARRRATGFGLYGTLGIEKGNKEAMQAQLAKNYSFFGAPVGLFFTIENDMEHGSWLDLGMFIQTVMIAARAFDLHTCPQQAWSRFYRVISPIMGIPDNEVLVCGMALGNIDHSEPANKFWTEREPVEAFARFNGF